MKENYEKMKLISNNDIVLAKMIYKKIVNINKNFIFFSKHLDSN